MQIVLPSTDPVLIATDRPQAFEAVAYDGQQDITAQVTWSWDFDDGSAADTDNPTEHVFETAGDYTVTVTGTFSAQQEQQQIGVDAQAGTDAFVLARQLPGGAYQSLEGTEICHTRYLIAFDALQRGYSGVRFKSKRAWEQEFGAGTWVSTSQQIVLDGQQRNEAWVLDWTTSECPGQAVVGEPNGAVDWQIAGRYLEGVPPDDVEVDELIGEPTYTINNTVVSSASGVLRFDPADAELDECPISWTTGHQNIFGVKFTVPIHIYDLAGNELYTYTKQNAERTGDSWTWDGTIFEQEPEGPTTASKGIYTYRLGVVGSQGTCGGVHCACTEPGEGCARGDWDKSAFLTVGIDKFYWFEQDPVAGTLKGVVKYTLNQDAWPGSVTIRFFGPDLEELDYPLTDQPYLGGTHFSDVYQIDAQYDENDALIGPIYCVIYANECEDTALLNRAGDSKPALQMGTSQLTAVTNHITPSGPVMISTLHDDDYPLEQQTVDGQITVTAHFGAEWAGQKIYLAVFDPPDMSPYVSDPQNWEAIWTDETKWDDNVDDPGTLSTTEATAVLVGEGQKQEAVVTAVLTITDYAAGDNYVVAAQPGEPPTIRRAMEEFDGGAGHLLVAWARKYYTVGEMYQGGTYLTALGGKDDDFVEVNDCTAFQVNDRVHIFSTTTRIGEWRTVVNVDQELSRLELDEPLEENHNWGMEGPPGLRWVPLGWVAREAENRWQLPSAWADGLSAAYGALAQWQGVQTPAVGEQYNGHCFIDWCAVGETGSLPHLANPWLDLPQLEPNFRERWAWHPPGGEADHTFLAVCERADLSDHSPRGQTPVFQGVVTHMSYVFAASCAAGPILFDPGKDAAHEMGHFMGIGSAVSDMHHPELLAHPHDIEDYDPTIPPEEQGDLEDYGCVMDYLADQGNTYCEFCVNCIGTVRGAGTR